MVDAGNACRIASTYLRDELRHLRLVSFETDELVDYRGARPHATFDGTSFTEVEIPELTLSLVRREGSPLPVPRRPRSPICSGAGWRRR